MFMLKRYYICIFFILLGNAFSKEINVDVKAEPSELSSTFNEEQLLLLKGFKAAITNSLKELNLDSNLYWTKLEKKNFSLLDESKYLNAFFENPSIARPAPVDPKQVILLQGKFKALLDIEKLSQNYDEVINDLDETRLKTFYFIPSIELKNDMSWEDVGVLRAENFTSVIFDSWQKLLEREFTLFDKIKILEKDLAVKPDFMNSKSITLKWKSVINKVSESANFHNATYEINAQFILQNTKTGSILTSMDFPEQKKTLDLNNKKLLSSTLASLIYNLFLSQTSKLKNLLEADAKAENAIEFELKITGSLGLSEINQLNSLLKEKFKEINLVSKMKSYSTDSSSVLIRAHSSEEKILELLSREGGIYPLNEQKVLLFNPKDKTFAIIPKKSNN